MFAALAQQLFYVKVNGTEHARATKELRKKSADYIKANYDSFQHEIKGRVLDRNLQAENIQQECSVFVNHCLPKPGCWGGFESLKAISQIYKVNILIFNENGDYYFAQKFNMTYDRSVFIGFSNANKHATSSVSNDRNHYDPVVEINPKILEECSRNIAQKLVETRASIIYLDSSQL